MGTNSASPRSMHELAGELEREAGDVEAIGGVGAELCRQFGHWQGATAIAGASVGSAAWAMAWAASLVQRAELLEQYEVVAFLGAAAAGGAGPGLGMARSWALGSAAPDFAGWYAGVQAQIIAAAARRREVAAGRALADRLRRPEVLLYEADDLIAALAALGPVALGALFEDLGPDGVRHILDLGSHDPMWGPVWEFDDAFALALARAWPELPDDFTLPLFTRAPWELLFTVAARGDFTGEYVGLLAAKMASQGFVPYISYSSPWYYPEAMSDLAERIESDPAARRALATTALLYARWDEPFGQFDAWVLDLVAEELPALDDEAFIALIDAVLLDDGVTASIDNAELANLLIGHALERDVDPDTAAYILGVLVHAQAHNGVPIPLETALVDRIVSQMPRLIDVTDGVRNEEIAAFRHPVTGDLLTVDARLLGAAIRNTVRNEAARAALLEGLTGYFAVRAASLELVDASELQNASLALADDIGAMTGLLIAAVNAADIEEARDRDEAVAAMVGMIDTIIGVIPGPGGALVEGLTAGFEKDLVKNIINTSYGELIDRGLALVETSHEGAARAGAEDFRAALTGRMEELLVVALVDAHVGVTDSIEAFLATDAASGLDASFWDPGTGFLTDEISRRVAYNEWYEWVGHEYPSIVSAVTVYLTQLQSELPVWSD